MPRTPSAKRTIRIAVAWMSRRRAFRRVGPRLMPHLEKLFSTVSGGRLQAPSLLVPSLTLHTLGARSGQPRSTVLMYTPDLDGRSMIVIGSNYAGAEHPAWTYNLLVHPDTSVEVGRRTMPVTAHLVDDTEREQVWAHVQEQWPGYRTYEADANRTFRIFRLVPVNPV